MKVAMYKLYDSYRYQVMWHHPKLQADPEQYACYYETNFLEYAKHYAMTLLGKGATVYVYDTEYNVRVKDFETHEKEKPTKVKRNKPPRKSE